MTPCNQIFDHGLVFNLLLHHSSIHIIESVMWVLHIKMQTNGDQACHVDNDALIVSSLILTASTAY